MQPCYFWISVTFGPCTVYVITGEIFLVIIKHITGPTQRKTALTSVIFRVVLQCSLFSVHLVRETISSSLWRHCVYLYFFIFLSLYNDFIFSIFIKL